MAIETIHAHVSCADLATSLPWYETDGNLVVLVSTQR
jgi:hypothetical protein